MSEGVGDGGEERPVRVHGYWTMPATGERWSPEATLRRSAWADSVDLRFDVAHGDDMLLGWTAAELRGIRAHDVVHPDDRDLLDVACLATPAGFCRFVPLELRFLARDSRYWWTRWQLNIAPDDAGGLDGVDYLRSAGWGSPVATWCWNVDRDVVSWSPELFDMFGLEMGPPASLASFLAAVHDDDRDSVAGHVGVAVDCGGPFRYTFRCPTGGGRDAWFHAAGRCHQRTDGTRVVAGLVKYMNPPSTPPADPVIGCG
jgi:PAS domain-containing protein